MQFVLERPRDIRSFSYNPNSLVLIAYHTDGASTVCSEVPPEMFDALARTLSPEDLFVRYIRTQFDCEEVAPSRAPLH